MERKYFENPYQDYAGEGFEVDEDFVRSSIAEYVQIIIQNTFPKSVYGGDKNTNLFIGTAGIAYMFYKMHISPRDFKAYRPLFHAQEYIFDSKRNAPNYRHKVYEDFKAAFFTGNAGMYCVSAAISSAMEQEGMMANDLINFHEGYEKCLVFDFISHGRDTMLVGRSGFLSGIYFLNKHMLPQQYTNEQILDLCQLIVRGGRDASLRKGSSFPLVYPYHRCEHFGAMYGISSILFTLLSSPWFYSEHGEDFPNVPKDVLGFVTNSIERLMDFQYEDGHFANAVEDFEIHPSMRPPPLIQWCHGVTGVMLLLLKAYKIFRDQKYLNAARRAADGIWQRGLVKSNCLCHGIAGNGYAFLEMYRATNDRKYLFRAFKFAQFLTTPEFREVRNEDAKYSLFEGLSGVVCFLMDLLNPLEAQFPFMDI
ncbi:LanC-like protein 3 like [Pseudolycoriella hygida]|uniref:LanC-like protein 3 like n=1 Tax=Pseudolycoriella hygida TaxID=35572 RepID=A0A9Q0NEH6_9DIPT|nr:LanC-like protein 3 like [Pseudolycoriella hygida]